MTKNSLRHSLNEAKLYEKKGNFAEARRLYEAILKIFPNNKKALEGINSLSGRKISSDHQNLLQPITNQLVKLCNEGEFVEVFKQTQKLTFIYPSALEVWNLLGISAAQTGNLDKAITAFNKIISLDSKQFSAYYNLGNALKDKGKLTDAIKAYTKALKIKPDYEVAYKNLLIAVSISDRPIEKQTNEIIESYQKRLIDKADNADGQFQKGVELQVKGKFEEAISQYYEAIRIWPNYSEAYFNIGISQQTIGNLEQSINNFKKAISIKPDYAEAYVNLGNALLAMSDETKAIEAYHDAISIKPNYSDAYSNLSIALKNLGKLDKAIEACNKALLIEPDHAEANNNLSLLFLNDNKLQGLEFRKWRWKTKGHQNYIRNFCVPEWDGNETLEGKTLLVWGEQGPGDMVIWSSCIEYFASKAACLILECHPKLVDLFQNSFPYITVRAEDKKLTTNDYDFQVPMETLFSYALMCGAIVQRQKQYLFPIACRTKYWKNRLNSKPTNKLVGICWKSPVMNIERANNYPELSDWEKILRTPNCTFVNLQSTDYEKDLEFFSKNYGSNIIDLSDLNLHDDLLEVAALSKALDCVVSVATAAATISSAVGTPTYIPTWRQSPWNNCLFSSRGPKVKVHCKDTKEAWTSVFDDIKCEIDLIC